MKDTPRVCCFRRTTAPDSSGTRTIGFGPVHHRGLPSGCSRRFHHHDGRRRGCRRPGNHRECRCPRTRDRGNAHISAIGVVWPKRAQRFRSSKVRPQRPFQHLLRCAAACAAACMSHRRSSSDPRPPRAADSSESLLRATMLPAVQVGHGIFGNVSPGQRRSRRQPEIRCPTTELAAPHGEINAQCPAGSKLRRDGASDGPAPQAGRPQPQRAARGALSTSPTPAIREPTAGDGLSQRWLRMCRQRKESRPGGDRPNRETREQHDGDDREHTPADESVPCPQWVRRIGSRTE